MSKRTAAILLSRQPLRPSGQMAWVKQSVDAIHWLKNRGFVFCSSIGMQTWELLTAFASLEKVKQTLFIAAGDDHEYEQSKVLAIAQFDLNCGLVDFIPVFSEKRNTTKEELWLERDKAVLEAADILVPVSLRKGGHMDSLLQRLRQQGKDVEDRFQIDYEKRVQPLAYRLKEEQLNPELRKLEDRYLIHWTRASNSAWPTERLIDYYQAVIESESYPRSAFSTLTNIIATGIVVATSKNMPHGIPTVSFSGLAPVDVVPLVRWRSRFRQMSFEPYGVGIEKEYAMSKGICPVQYYDRNCNNTSDSEPWLWQSVGEKSDWRAEKEYRYKGDFDLATMPSSRLLNFCYTQGEVEIIEKSTGIRAVSFQ